MKLNTADFPEGTMPGFSKSRIATHFGLKVSRYGHHAVIQQQLLRKLLPFILEHTQPGERWTDFGCGNGALEKALLQHRWKGSITGIDIAFESLRFCSTTVDPEGRWVCADAEQPPLKARTFKGMVVASMLQWSSRPAATISTLLPLLQPDGVFVFSLFTGDAFRELFVTRNRLHLPPPVSVLSEDAVEPMLKEAGLVPVTIHPFSATEYFPSAGELLRHLSSIGSTGLASRPLSRTRLQQFYDTLEDEFGTEQGVPLTYKAQYGIARKGDGY